MVGIAINCTRYVGHGGHHFKGTMISRQAESSKLRLANLSTDESAVEGQVGMESSHERRAWYVGGNMREAYNSEAQIWIRADLPPQQLPCNCHCPLPTTIIHHKSYHAIPTTQRGIDGNLIYESPPYHFHCDLASISHKNFQKIFEPFGRLARCHSKERPKPLKIAHNMHGTNAATPC